MRRSGRRRPGRAARGRKARLGVMSLFLVVVLFTAVTPALAATVVYKNSTAPADTWVTSGIANITGGKTTSSPLLYVYIRTTVNFYPYYPLVTGEGTYWVSISHSRQALSRSRCRISPFDNWVKCEYHT